MAALPRLSTYHIGAGQRLWYILYFFVINRKRAAGNSVMFMLFHWYCHRCFGCGKKIPFTLKIFNIFSDVYTWRECLTLSMWCKCTGGYESYPEYTSFASIPFTPSTKWHDHHIYLSIYHVPYLMSLSSLWHCSKTLILLGLKLEYRVNIKSADDLAPSITRA